MSSPVEPSLQAAMETIGVYMGIYALDTSMSLYIYMYTHMHIHPSIRPSVHPSVRPCRQTDSQTDHIHTPIHACMHAYIHTYTAQRIRAVSRINCQLVYASGQHSPPQGLQKAAWTGIRLIAARRPMIATATARQWVKRSCLQSMCSVTIKAFQTYRPRPPSMACPCVARLVRNYAPGTRLEQVKFRFNFVLGTACRSRAFPLYSHSAQ